MSALATLKFLIAMSNGSHGHSHPAAYMYFPFGFPASIVLDTSLITSKMEYIELPITWVFVFPRMQLLFPIFSFAIFRWPSPKIKLYLSYIIYFYKKIKTYFYFSLIGSKTMSLPWSGNSFKCKLFP